MLKLLTLRNIALVDELSLAFAPALNVLTGETGAGKSIIIDAVAFLLGGKADRDLIRHGTSKAYVEGLFDVSHNEPALAFLREQELEDDDGQLMLSRELNQSGRSICRIGGVAVNLGQLRELSSMLLDIHGQHDHQSLLDERNHLGYLDSFGDQAHQDRLQLVRQAYAAWAALEQRLKESLSRHAEREQRLELLRLREQELARAKAQPGEEEELKRRLEQLRNSGKIKRSLDAAYSSVYDSGRDAMAALALLSEARRAMDDIAGFSDPYEALRDRLDSLYYEAEDVGLELREALASLDADESALQSTAERLDLLKRLARKLGLSADELPDALEQARAEIAELEGLGDSIDQLEAERDQALKVYQDAAAQLSASRVKLGKQLSTRMEAQLSSLNMAGTRFLLQLVSHEDKPVATGAEQARMLISPNLGEEPMPLGRIASGGETSRLMLALKAIAAERSMIPAMIFDEIDTGISGRTAQVVAERLWDIAQYRQVLCVSHLQQIAAMASTHFLVEKQEQQGRTLTLVKEISGEARVKELSRIISGFGEDCRSSLSHACHMLGAAEEYRLANGG